MTKYFGLLSTFLLPALAAYGGCAPTTASNDDASVPAEPDGGIGRDGSVDAPGPALQPASTCSTGSLFAGNPVYDGAPLDRPAPGTGILDDPPLQWQNIVFAGHLLYTRDTGEIWGVDTSVASPVENRIAGLNAPNKFAYGPGDCASARFAKIEGMAALPDGSLLVADVLGNGVLHITSPNGPSCAVEVWAGNTTASDDIDASKPVPNQGDVDGDGASAKFDSPAALTVDDAGNAYVFDVGNRKIKKIAAAAPHVVTTVGTLSASDPGKLTNLTRIGNTIYGVGSNGIEAVVVSVDAAGGEVKTVIQGRGDEFPPLGATTAPAIAGLTTDGHGLVLSGNGYVWYLDLEGKITHIAGTGMQADFPKNGYDPKSTHPALDLQLPPSGNGSVIGSSDYITYHEGAVYYRGRHTGTASFVERIACP
ncbi:MAG: hypothetical protein KF819_38890 [Labilithrix sp.]|nr:hypothetical protein [Labilithrix sp.]